eukprot:Nk52_evm2s470 gene=Nk52_evmTU2s470
MKPVDVVQLEGRPANEIIEVNIYDRGIKSIKRDLLNLNQLSNLVTLNLHSNSIAEINGLESLTNLRHLNLSSNQIQKMKGMESLFFLRSLDLACNQIQKVEGLEGLLALKRINLSFNRIHQLDGFACLSEDDSSSLTSVELRGNHIRNINDFAFLSNCANLRTLYLSDKEHEAVNPVCSVPKYRKRLFELIPSLSVLDGFDKYGNLQEEDEQQQNNDSEFPGLDSYLDYLNSSGGSEDALGIGGDSGYNAAAGANTSFDSELDIETPNIDKILQKSKEYQKPHTIKVTVNTKTESAAQSSRGREVQSPHTRSKRELLVTERGPLNNETSRASSSQGYPCVPSRASYQPSALDDSSSIMPEHDVSMHSAHGTKTVLAILSEELAEERALRKRAELNLEEYRNTMEKACDREERLESEKDVLLKRMKQLSESVGEKDNAIIELYEKVKVASKHQQDLSNELDNTKVQLVEMRKIVSEKNNILEDRENEIDALKQKVIEVGEKAIASENQLLATREQKVNDFKVLEGKVTASERELDIYKKSMKQAKAQINQLQELLADREEEHRKLIAKRIENHNAETKALLESSKKEFEMNSSAKSVELENQLAGEIAKMRDMKEMYEKRLAFEKNTIITLQDEYTRLSEETEEVKEALRTEKQREGRSVSMVAELTVIIKEQKAKIIELAQDKQFIKSQLERKISELECEKEVFVAQLDDFQTVKTRLSESERTITAQESVIVGLREERTLWSRELAEQGAALSHEKGMLEARMESTARDCEGLRAKIQEQQEVINIKNKMLEDQNLTISQFKSDITSKELEFQHLEDQFHDIERDLKQNLEEQTIRCRALEKELDRNEQIKVRKDLEASLAETRKALDMCKKRIQDKEETIKYVEEEVEHLKDLFSEEKRKMKTEFSIREGEFKDQISSLTRSLNETKRELTVKGEQYLETVDLLSKKQKQISKAEEQIQKNEEEMRDLLRDVGKERKAMEIKMEKFNQAIQGLQKDFKY